MKIGTYVKEVATSWSTDKISSLSAALAYYSLFSLTPILLISVSLVGIFFSEHVARGEILNEITNLIGENTSVQIKEMIEAASNRPKIGVLGHIVSLIVLFIGSSAVFTEMQSSLNFIWGVQANPKRRWYTIIKQRILSFIMVLAIAFILFLSLVLGLILTAMSTYLNQFWNIGIIEIFFVHGLSSLILIFLFAMIFKILPDVNIKWRDVWLGAIITTILFTIGKFALGIYLSKVEIASAFGAAGSLIILLVWVYYSSQIFFIGAEITKVFAFEKRKKIAPIHQALVIDAHPVHDHPTSKSNRRKEI